MFASSGDITAPCGVPSSVTLTNPSFITPASSHLRIKRITRASPTRLWCKFLSGLYAFGFFEIRIRRPVKHPEFRYCGCGATQLAGLKLILLNLLDKLDAADAHCRVIKPFESEHRSGPLFYSPMVLLNHIVEILARPHPDPPRQPVFHLQFSHGMMYAA